MKNKILKALGIVSRNDPHEVYYRIFPHSSLSDEVLYLRAGLIKYTSRFFFIRVLLVLVRGYVTLCRSLKYRNCKIIFFEFDPVAILFFLYPASFVVNLDGVHLNINHQLNKILYKKFLLRLLSSRFKIIFIEPSKELMLSCSWITPLWLDKKIHSPYAGKIVNVFIFCGFRDEQMIPNQEIYLSSLQGLSAVADQLSVRLIGRNVGKKLSNKEFFTIFNKNSIIVNLYNPTSYEFRHTGLILECLVKGVKILLPNNSLNMHYRNNFSDVYLFDNPIDFYKTLTLLASPAYAAC